MDEFECFGCFEECEKCRKCQYSESCKFSKDDTARTEQQDKHWRNSCSEYIDNINGRDDGLPVDISEDRSYSRDEVVAIAAFLLRIGRDRKLGKILNTKLMGVQSFAAMARQEGVTRQAIHKRVGKQLAKIFGFKSRQLTDSRLMTLNPDEFHLLKLQRAGLEDQDILEIMHISPEELKNKKGTLEWKIMKYT